jgi:RHS repeat-associated protein
MVVNESKPNSGNGTELRPVPTLDVWFDDIEVVHTEALIVQENHYDPYGLSLSGIEKENKPEDKWKFQDKELITELDLNWQDFGARFYDPQLGRWHCVDPADQFSSSYVGLANNPANAVDPDGRFIPAAIIPFVVAGLIGGTVNVATNWSSIASSGDLGTGLARGLGFFGVGAAGGAVSVNNIFAGGAIISGGNAFLGGVTEGKSAGEIAENTVSQGLMGGISSYVGGQFSKAASPVIEKITSKVLNPVLGAGLNGGIVGGTINAGITFAMTGDFGQAGAAFGSGFGIGAASGAGGKMLSFAFNGSDIWTGSKIGLGDGQTEFPNIATGEFGGGNRYTIRNVNGSDVRAANTSTRFVSTAEGVVHDLKPTLDRIASGGKFPHTTDGSIFKNMEGLLPKQNAGYYKEFVHPTPGVKGPGAMRVVIGQGGEMWFTPDHYKTFIPIR